MTTKNYKRRKAKKTRQKLERNYGNSQKKNPQKNKKISEKAVKNGLKLKGKNAKMENN